MPDIDAALHEIAEKQEWTNPDDALPALRRRGINVSRTTIRQHLEDMTAAGEMFRLNSNVFFSNSATADDGADPKE